MRNRPITLQKGRIVSFGADNVAQEAADVAEAVDWSQGMRGNVGELPGLPALSGLYNRTSPLPIATILDTDLKRYGAMMGAGSYQVMVTVKTTAYETLRYVQPVVCKVQAGAGAIVGEFEVDAGQVFSVPSDSFRISAFFDTYAYAWPGGNDPQVAAATITASLIRSGQTFNNRVTRTRSVQWGGTSLLIPKPPLAKDVRIYMPNTVVDITTWEYLAVTGPVPPHFVLDKLVDGDLPRYMRGACIRPLPANCDHIHLVRDVDDGPVDVVVEFGLALGGK